MMSPSKRSFDATRYSIGEGLDDHFISNLTEEGSPEWNSSKTKEFNRVTKNLKSIEIGIKSTNQIFSIKPIFLLLIIWLFSFLLILYFFLRVDHLRTYVIQDLLPMKEIDELERKVQRILRYEEKHGDNLHQKEDDFDSFAKSMNLSLSRLISEIPVVSSQNISYATKKSCKPIENIAFIKTHKTASSTVTNILNRYADLEELLVALPANGDVRFAWPRKFHWSSVDLLRLDGQPANVLTNHVRFNRDEMSMIMEENTKYVSILRNPVTQFESSFYYFEFDKFFHLKNKQKNPIEEFLKFPDEHLYNMTLVHGDLPDTLNLIQSGMFYDLGYDFIDLEHDDVIRDTLNKLENELEVIMIMEYFDESLVLLMKEFCWDFDDILYIKQNQRVEHHITLSQNSKDRIKRWSHADVMLYEHFNETFWKKVSKYGQEFWKDVSEFKVRNAEFEKACSPSKLTMKGFGINVDVSTFVMNPKVDRYNRYLCEKVLMTEVDYLSYFRKKFGINFGYQNLLIAEGLKPLKKTHRLQIRLKKSARKNKKPKFLPMKGFEKKKKK